MHNNQGKCLWLAALLSLQDHAYRFIHLLPLSPPLKSPHKFNVDIEYSELSRPAGMHHLEVVFTTNGFPEQLGEEDILTTT